MDLRMRLEHEDAEAFRALDLWLRREPDLRGRTSLVRTVPGPGEMGGVADVLMMAVGGGGAFTTLAASLRVFFAQPRRSDLTVRVETPDGRTIAVDAKRVANPEDLQREILGNSGES
ncbi:hypothetical protein AB0N05_09815 [Nocardia sp. NPDC051030]|uniref:effector-associated constant component EACC1 n=1 Tax=Nocardia sp. NPDC051030 TaxID=3155162 RepID=UPI00342CFB5F